MLAPSHNAIVKEKLVIRNPEGEQLAALLERPAAPPAAFALFAHCFTCSKDIAAASRISRALAARGIAVVRFDFTGLGNSEGDFANTNFSSNVQDLIAVADHLRRDSQAPALLIGHSLGGAAVLAAAAHVPEAKAVVTIGAPSDPAHLQHLFAEQREEIERNGAATVNLAGRQFKIKKQFLDDIEQHNLEATVGRMLKALLVFHSPVDDIVNIDHARLIFEAARHPKSFVSLDTADHLLSNKRDSAYVAQTIAAWSGRYVIAERDPEPAPRLEAGEVLLRETDGKFGQVIFTDSHRMLADEPARYGGHNTGPSPYEFLLMALGACTSMTVRMYASRKGLPLEAVAVKLRHDKIHAEDCAECDTREGKVDSIWRELSFTGALTEEQRNKLLEIADKCPVHRTLHSEIRVETTGV